MGLSVIPAKGKPLEAVAGAQTGKPKSGFFGILASELKSASSTGPQRECEAIRSVSVSAQTAASGEEAEAGEKSGTADPSPTSIPTLTENAGDAHSGSRVFLESETSEDSEPVPPVAEDEADGDDADAGASGAVPELPAIVVAAVGPNSAAHSVNTTENSSPSGEAEEVKAGRPGLAGIGVAKAMRDDGGRGVSEQVSGGAAREGLKVSAPEEPAGGPDVFAETGTKASSADMAADAKAAGTGSASAAVLPAELPGSGIFVEKENPVLADKARPPLEQGAARKEFELATATAAVPTVENADDANPAFQAGVSQGVAPEVAGDVRIIKKAWETAPGTAESASPPATRVSVDEQELSGTADDTTVEPAPAEKPALKNRGHHMRSGWRLWPKASAGAKVAPAAPAPTGGEAAVSLKARAQKAESPAMPKKAEAAKSPEGVVKAGQREESTRVRKADEPPKVETNEATPPRERAAAFSAESGEGASDSGKADLGSKAVGQPVSADPRAEAPERRAEPQQPLREAKEILRQVQGPLRVAFLQRGERAVIQLMPEALGKVHVEISRTGHGMTANFRVETVEAKEALTSQVVQLQKGFEGRGVNLVSVNVELGNDRSAGNGGQAGQRRKGRPQPQMNARMETDKVGAGESAWKPWGFETRA